MVELTKNTHFNLFVILIKFIFAQLCKAKLKFFLNFFGHCPKGGGGGGEGMSTICIGEIQCVPYAEFLGTCVCVSVSPTFATKDT